MPVDWVRRSCLSFPHVTETVQWGDNLVFKVAGKMFCVAGLEPGEYCMSFKCSAEKFVELTEREDVSPAPYLARASWVALRPDHTLPIRELERLLREAYDLVVARLPKKAAASLSAKAAPPPSAARRGSAATPPRRRRPSDG
jgi:predicted DNA-binding protein (MmcQ/YjbR family)